MCDKLISCIQFISSTSMSLGGVFPFLSLSFFSIYSTSTFIWGGNILCYLMVASSAFISTLIGLLEEFPLSSWLVGLTESLNPIFTFPQSALPFTDGHWYWSIGTSFVNQYPTTWVYIGGFKIFKNQVNILQVLW